MFRFHTFVSKISQAVEKIAGQRLSIAIFAPGWSFETHTYDEFPTTDDQLWNKCAKFYYFRTLTNMMNESSTDGSQALKDDALNLIPDNNNYKVFVSTDFDQGFGHQRSFFGLVRMGRFIHSQCIF